ncbi:hypothetical protein Pan44_31450 [Caulifigura coniformis]|uniref:Planctomycete cytochrome C n=1 Tax=Caulifigura coniformis TaxID=2527983 RepID=A0A517SG46_9PLAN|nr:DUF1592 domain-containing protein [Caulifigura coniformis]QDT55103.1 hypothetical protein Pan44_31450 [Caulifigura coniformis]
MIRFDQEAFDGHGPAMTSRCSRLAPGASGRLAFALLLLAGLAPGASSRAADTLEPRLKTYLDTHCVVCHGADSPKSDFRIDTLSPRIGLEDTPQWLEVMERISSGEMPPPDYKQRPGSQESTEIVELLSARMKEGEAARLAARGRVSYNRLSREEYVNTVRDLIGVQYNATDPGGFLEDPEWRGLERIGSVMTLSPSQIEKYLAAAEVVLAEAYPSKKPPLLEFTKRAIIEKQIDPPHRERLNALGLIDKVRYEMWPGDLYRYSGSEPLPEAGIYEISYTLSGLKPENGRAPRLFVYESKLDRVLHEEDVVAPEDQPVTVTFQAHLPKGRPDILVINQVPGPSNNPRSGRHGRTPFLSTKEGRIPWQMKLTDEQGRPRYPFLILDSVSFRGPIVTAEEQRRREEYFPSEPGNMDQVRAGLGRLARRAFRRPAAPGELEAYVGIVRDELAAGEPFAEALKAGMLAILCSKSFLFVTEGDEHEDRTTLNDWEIASRLSYLLWSTMPDDELLLLAEQGKLRDQKERARQLARMLADPRARRFSDSFAGQWLQLRNVGKFPPDKKLYPDYDSSLEKAMVEEPRAFFQEVLHEGLTLREFIDSDWSMLNARLAKFYGLPETGLTGSAVQRVSLSAESHRGGLLTQAAILSLTSDGTRHRPVHRGKWVSEAILGRVPPPPPANVDPIEPNPVDAPKATLRMKLEAHIHDARCASCHSKIDPLGLAFENFDAIGRWREEETVEGTGSNPRVNSAGQFPDGRRYETPEEFKGLMLGHLDDFQAAFIEKLACYGLRRTMSFDDRDELKEIAAAGRADDYRLRSILEAFVVSDLFVKR